MILYIHKGRKKLKEYKTTFYKKSAYYFATLLNTEALKLYTNNTNDNF